MEASSMAKDDPPQVSYVGTESHYFVIRPVGKVDGVDLINLAAQARTHPGFDVGAPLMWDMREAEVGDFGSMPQLTQQIEKELQNNAGGRTVFVTNSELGYGLSRASAAWSSLAGDRDLRVFRAHEFDKAVAWLSGEENTVD